MDGERAHAQKERSLAALQTTLAARHVATESVSGGIFSVPSGVSPKAEEEGKLS